VELFAWSSPASDLSNTRGAVRAHDGPAERGPSRRPAARLRV